MKFLFIHADFIEYEVRQKAIAAEETDEKGRRLEETLVVFTAVEDDDERNDAVIGKGVAEIADVANKLKVERLVLYPYAHLSSSLAAPEEAKRILKEIETGLKERGYDVHRAPFGWYKSFTLKCKGHPLSELSRSVSAKKDEGRAKTEGRAGVPGDKTGEDYMVLTSSGSEIQLKDEKDFPGTENKAFGVMVAKEAFKREHKMSGEPEYHRLCKKFGIEWEEMSDSGHMRFGPKAALIFDLASDYSHQVVYSLSLPIFTVKGTNMFDLEEKAVKEHADLYGDRLYTIKDKEGKKEYVMRYAACHQQFAMIRHWKMSYKQLPFGAFEVADSYRLEQSGECMLCFRTRRMNMPDLHVFCKDIDEAKDWFSRLHDKIYEEVKKLGRDYEMLLNFSSRKVYEENKEWILSLLKSKGKDALLHFYPEGINYYWTVNIEYHIMDAVNRAREIATVQIDVGNAERFGIEYTDENGRGKRPIILHTAILGTIERFLYTILDTAVAGGRKELGTIPLWLNPEQVRLLSVGDKHISMAESIAKELEANSIRVGLDDRAESIARKVRDAKTDWVGYVIVVGDKELQGGKLNVYVRKENANREYQLDELIGEIRKETDGKPFRKIYFPREVSRRPVFRG